jgi:hypothetical protein
VLTITSGLHWCSARHRLPLSVIRPTVYRISAVNGDLLEVAGS